MKRTRRMLGVVLGVMALGCCVGCGDSNTGNAEFVIFWPRTSDRMIPSEANSITIDLAVGGYNGEQLPGSRRIVRPASPNEETGEVERFTSLPTGLIYVTARAYPSAAATGVPQAQAQFTMEIRGNQTTREQLSLNTTVTTFRIDNRSPVVAVGGQLTVRAEAFDSQGRNVIIPPVSWFGQAGTNVFRLINSAAGDAVVIEGRQAGTATLTARVEQERGSSQSALTDEVTVEVTAN